MKQYIKSLIIFVTALGIFSACNSNFEDINNNPNKIEKVSQGSLLSPILYNVGCFNYNRANDFTFNLMQVALPFPSEGGALHRYYMLGSEGNSTWSTYYRWLTSVREMYKMAVEANDPNYQAIAITLRSWMFANLTDCFGDVPMKEACQGEEGIYQPAFDTQKEIYETIIADLDSANTLFNTSKALTFTGDILYNANSDATGVLKWKKFCNSLRMRSLLRISNRDNEMHAFDKLSEMVNNPIKYPVFTSNEDGALLTITGITPLLTPIARPQDFTSYRAAGDFFVDNLNKMNDPRTALYVGTAKDLATSKSIGYKGAPSGYEPGTVFTYTPSNMNQTLAKAPLKIIFMSYAEVKFIMAELAQKGIISGDAKTLYEDGTKAAITQWGATVPANYFTDPDAAYNGTLERIHLQKYYALFFTDYQQWFEYRRTYLPSLPKNGGLLNGKRMPVRFQYPAVVIANNPKNYEKAVLSMGGDSINTKNWWEK